MDDFNYFLSFALIILTKECICGELPTINVPVNVPSQIIDTASFLVTSDSFNHFGTSELEFGVTTTTEESAENPRLPLESSLAPLDIVITAAVDGSNQTYDSSNIQSVPTNDDDGNIILNLSWQKLN